MRFTFISTFLYADAETSSRTAENEFCLLRKRTRSFFEAFSLAFFVCSLLFSTNNGTFAQNAATKVNSANSVLSPEEATGVSLRDFDALRAMSSDYLKNPDGKEVPNCRWVKRNKRRILAFESFPLQKRKRPQR